LTTADVCFRIDNPALSVNGTGVPAIAFGGMIAVTPTPPGVTNSGIGPPSASVPTIGMPTTDGNASYCAAPPSGAPANQIPGQHPMSTGMLPTGSSWSFDLYTD